MFPITSYLSGFGNHFETESVAGALPLGRNSPQRVAMGLYAEQLSGSAFTAPRCENRRSWLYRLRPSADHAPYRAYPGTHLLRSGPFDEVAPSPNRLRWGPLPLPDAPADFIDGLITWAGNGAVSSGCGVGIHLYSANCSMRQRVFFSADGELLFVPQFGRIRLTTEMGVLNLSPGEIAVVPRGVRFKVELPDDCARGYVCENYGRPFSLPELGPIGSNGLANPRDFQTPIASWEDCEETTQVVQKFSGALWVTDLDRSPFDVVAWHGNLAPYKYDLARFNAMGTVGYDHADPSIFTVLTSPSDTAGTANCDFVIFPPRWLVAEDTFRPPWFHRNVMSEFMGLIHGHYDAKAGGFTPGGVSLHNSMAAHGPDRTTTQAAIAAELKPHKIDNTMAFMFESRSILRPTAYAMSSPLLQSDYDDCWRGFSKARVVR